MPFTFRFTSPSSSNTMSTDSSIAKIKELHPTPQRHRGQDSWVSLDGEWSFAFDDDDVGLQEGWYRPSVGITEKFKKTIKVPFAYQTPASGIDSQDHHEILWYSRTIDTSTLRQQADHVMLHFQAVDYDCQVYINGELAISHTGGQTAFQSDITRFLYHHRSENTQNNSAEAGFENIDKADVLAVRVVDRFVPTQTRGKQWWRDSKPAGIMYTSTSGIVGPVWLEAVPKDRFMASSLVLTSNVDDCVTQLECDILSRLSGLTADITVSLNDSFVSRTTVPVHESRIFARLPMGDPTSSPSAAVVEQLLKVHGPGDSLEACRENYRGCALWSPELPTLYDIKLELKDKEGKVLDVLNSYTGMRQLEWKDGRIKLNGVPYFQRLVLDQGYWPDTALTPPSAEANKRDIELAKELGFNGARVHQKTADSRYLYYADKLGFLVWAESANAWQFSLGYVEKFIPEWMEIVKRSMSHPCVVCYVPANESWGVPTLNDDARQRAHLQSLYHLTRSLDPSRPIISNDGWETSSCSDILGHHMYAPPSSLGETFSSIEKIEYGVQTGGAKPAWIRVEEQEDEARFGEAAKTERRKKPVICTEFGGIGALYSGGKSPEELIKEVREQVAALLSGGIVQGFCYTQLADCYQEANGLVDPQRKFKADPKALRDAITQ